MLIHRYALAFATAAGLLVCHATPATAANWQAILATETGRKDQPLSLGGFVQVYGEGIVAKRVTGLAATPLLPFNGRLAVFNTNGETEASSTLSIRRARPILRGAIPGTDQRINYFLGVEFGKVGLTRGQFAAIADASMTFNYIPGARIRVGQFKLPLMDEGLESNPQVAAFINFSNPLAQLMLESQIVNGQFVGGAYGFRDLGIQVFDWFRFGSFELAYALVASQGRAHGLDLDDFKDVSGRIQGSLVLDGADNDIHRQEVSLFAWGQWGKRRLSSGVRDRVRTGGGLHMELRPVRFRAEVVYAANALILGSNPAFLNEAVVVSDNGKALGYNAQVSYQVLSWFSIHARYEELHRQLGEGAAFRLFRTLTPGIEFNPHPKVRLVANADFRWLHAPSGNADAKRIVETMGPRFTAQATLNF